MEKHTEMTTDEATAKATIGWVACDYTQGDAAADVRCSIACATYAEALTLVGSGRYDGVRYAAADGYLYVDQPA